jgi:hypothetical protein
VFAALDWDRQGFVGYTAVAAACFAVSDMAVKEDFPADDDIRAAFHNLSRGQESVMMMMMMMVMMMMMRTRRRRRRMMMMMVPMMLVLLSNDRTTQRLDAATQEVALTATI